MATHGYMQFPYTFYGELIAGALMGKYTESVKKRGLQLLVRQWIEQLYWIDWALSQEEYGEDLIVNLERSAPFFETLFKIYTRRMVRARTDSVLKNGSKVVNLQFVRSGKQFKQVWG